MVSSADVDHRVRLRAFEFPDHLCQVHGETVPRKKLEVGFEFDGRRVPLIGPQGIWKPSVLPEMPLSITTAPVVEGKNRPYDDVIGDNNVLSYRYRGTDPRHRDNVGLRLAMTRRAPLVYLHGIITGKYAPSWPAYVVGDDPNALTFSVQVDDARLAVVAGEAAEPVFTAEVRRAYVTQVTRRRLHQQEFRLRVLAAYRRQCAVCRLRREELLEAAHILPDTHPHGEPVVPNGLALCNLHHAAFDRNVLGVRPDLVVVIRPDVLREVDGPMLLHGLQGFQESKLHVPSDRRLQPDTERLAERFEQYRETA